MMVIFNVFVHNFCDLDLLTLMVPHIISHVHPMHMPILSILRLSVPELWMTQSDRISMDHMEQSLRMCHVTWPITRGKNDPHFKNPIYSLCHFPGATTKIKLCNWRTIAFIPLLRIQSSVHMHSITWPVHNAYRGSPKTTHNNFWPNVFYLLITINFYGATMKITGSLYLSTLNVKVVYSHKKNSTVKIGPQNGGFPKI